METLAAKLLNVQPDCALRVMMLKEITCRRDRLVDNYYLKISPFYTGVFLHKAAAAVKYLITKTASEKRLFFCVQEKSGNHLTPKSRYDA